jgi:hypothetical protein
MLETQDLLLIQAIQTTATITDLPFESRKGWVLLIIRELKDMKEPEVIDPFYRGLILILRSIG